MNAILKKISSYNLFNYLLPGVLFVVIVSRITSYDLLVDDIVLGAFVYYFLGLVTSRIGSLVVEPAFKWFKFVEFAPYESFIRAEKEDGKIAVLSEANNMYRTFISLFGMILLACVWESLTQSVAWIQSAEAYLITVVMIFLFALSYRKQTSYITNRISARKHDDHH